MRLVLYAVLILMPFSISYAARMEPLTNCPPESTRGFFLRGGLGASPDNHEGIGVESSDAVSAGGADFFFPRPIILPSTCNNAENNDDIFRYTPTKPCSTKNEGCIAAC